jgi:hypothetical protein
LLEFILEIQELVGEPTDSNVAPDDIPASRVDSLVNHIYGGSVNIAIGSHNDQKAISIVKPNDVNTLRSSLEKVNIPSSDIESLLLAVKEDGKPKVEKAFGVKVKEWILHSTQKVADGIWDTTLTAAPTIATKILSKFYGWD